MTSATSALSVTALAKADEWRAHVGETSDASISADVVRSHEPGRGREANTPEEIPPRGWSDIVYRVFWSVFADGSTLGNHLTLLSGILPAGVHALISDQITLLLHQRSETLGTAFILGLVVALGSANSGAAALFDALNVVYNEEEKRSLLRFYATTFLFTLPAIFLVILAIMGIVVLPLVLKFVGLPTSTERLFGIMRWPILFATIAATRGVG